jgi:small subunit ribosomal protein S20
MPQKKSAKKRVKITLRNEQRNRAARSAMKSRLKAITDDKGKDRDAAVREHQALLDQAARRGVVHRNKAARLKSRFSSKKTAAS